MIYILFAIPLLILTVYSWGFVDPNAPFAHNPVLTQLVYQQRGVSSFVYIGLVFALFGWYFYLLRTIYRKQLSARDIVRFLVILVALLFLSFPAFSNDIFNYIATAKVLFHYHENPYIIMPIDISNEPMLRFLQAANKTALYGPSWLLLTWVPYILGFGNLLATVYTFKLVAVAFYGFLTLLIWKMTRNLRSVVIFAFNPLVILDTLVDGHNDVVMMFLALLSFLFLKKKRYVASVILLLLSIFVKGASVFLVPVFIWAWWKDSKKKVNWSTVWTYSGLSMFVIFLLSPIREEIYSWYFIWPLTFIAMRESFDVVTWVALGFTFGLPFRFLPFVYTRDWGGMTPLIKKLVTFIPPVVIGVGYAQHKRT